MQRQSLHILRIEFQGIIFCSKSLRGFTAVIRPAMSINEIFIHPEICSRAIIFNMFPIVDICVQLHLYDST